MKLADFPKRRILAFGDSNTYGYDPATDGRYGDSQRWPRVLEALLGEEYTVIEEGLPGRTGVFDDPITEGLSGLAYITPCMMSHAPLDTVVIMLGTNDTKERFGCNAGLIARGLGRLIKKAQTTEAWRGKPDVLVVCPTPIVPAYDHLMFASAMGRGCAEKSVELGAALEPIALAAGARFIDAGTLPGVEVHPLDGMHLTCEAHTALAQGLAAQLKR
jgi:lysophospholipase L1-like esterase